MFIPLSHPPPKTPVERLVRIIDGLCAAIAARGADALLTRPLFFLLWRRLRRIAVRATLVAARIAAGAPQPALRQRAASPRPPRPPALRLPRGYAWLVVLVPGTAAYGTQLQILLADPLMAPLAADPKLRGLLNPLCQMLGAPKPPPAPRPAAVSPRPPKPERDSGRTPLGCDPPPPACFLAA